MSRINYCAECQEIQETNVYGECERCSEYSPEYEEEINLLV